MWHKYRLRSSGNKSFIQLWALPALLRARFTAVHLPSTHPCQLQRGRRGEGRGGGQGLTLAGCWGGGRGWRGSSLPPAVVLTHTHPHPCIHFSIKETGSVSGHTRPGPASSAVPVYTLCLAGPVHRHTHARTHTHRWKHRDQLPCEARARRKAALEVFESCCLRRNDGYLAISYECVGVLFVVRRKVGQAHGLVGTDGANCGASDLLIGRHSIKANHTTPDEQWFLFVSLWRVKNVAQNWPNLEKVFPSWLMHSRGESGFNLNAVRDEWSTAINSSSLCVCVSLAPLNDPLKRKNITRREMTARD